MFRYHISQSELKELLDGELSPIASWRVRHHLTQCADCTHEWESLQKFHALLLSADIVTHQAIQSPRQELSAKPRAAWKIAGAMVMTAVLAIALFLAPDWHPTPRNMSVAVGAAVAQANTWHLSGWKQIDGKHVPWDVWGRRQPFLFYEKIGNDITVDDGTQRLRIYPPAPDLQRPNGLVIHTASQIKRWHERMLSTENMVRFWDWRQGEGLLTDQASSQTASQIVFLAPYFRGYSYGFNCNQRYTISKKTWLPIRYTLRYSARHLYQETESLEAQYNVDVPNSVVTPTIPIGYQTLDWSKPENASVNVQAQALALDSTGNVIVNYKISLAGNPVSSHTPFLFHVWTQGLEPPISGLHDSKHIHYIHSTVLGLYSKTNTNDCVEMYSPLEPLAHDLPQQMQVPLSVMVLLSVKGSDILSLQGVRGHGKDKILKIEHRSAKTNDLVLVTTMSQTIDLPKVPTTVSLEKSMLSDLQLFSPLDSLSAQICQSRVNYYLLSAKVAQIHSAGMSQEFDRSQFQRAIYWQQQLIDNWQGRAYGRWSRLDDTFALAKLYRDAGDLEKMRQTLRGLITEYQSVSEVPGGKTLAIDRARYAIRTAIFPYEKDYKGPK